MQEQTLQEKLRQFWGVLLKSPHPYCQWNGKIAESRNTLADFARAVPILTDAFAGKYGQPVAHVHAVDGPRQIGVERWELGVKVVDSLLELFHGRVSDERCGEHSALTRPTNGEFSE